MSSPTRTAAPVMTEGASRSGSTPAAVRHLRRAPITEALIDFRVAPALGADAQALRAAVQRHHDRYPQAEEMNATEAFIESGAGQALSTGVKHLGFRGLLLRSEDARSVAQFRVDGFTFNRLAPYTSWEEILPEALRLWQSYLDIARPLALTRLAVRYINRIELRGHTGDLDELFTAFPRPPVGVPQWLNACTSRVQTQDPDRRVGAFVTQVLHPGAAEGESAVILDIDAFREGEQDVAVERVASSLDTIRAYKNALFFGSITETLARTFE